MKCTCHEKSDLFCGHDYHALGCPCHPRNVRVAEGKMKKPEPIKRIVESEWKESEMNKHSKIIVRWYQAYKIFSLSRGRHGKETFESALNELLELGENLHNAALAIERMNKALDAESQQAALPERKTK